MGIVLEISLDREIREIEAFFDSVKFEAVTKSARQALNRTATRTRSLAIKEIRKQRKVKLEDLKGSKKKGKQGFVRIKKARGRNIAQLEARVDFLGVPLPLILFIIGQKTPMTQRQPNRSRRPRRFEIVKGDKRAKKGLFIEKAKRGSKRYQVFRRSDPKNKSEGFKMQTAPSLAELLRSKTSMMRRYHLQNRSHSRG